MSDDDAFLRAILADPSDDATRLVYADWLDEQGRHNQAEFLRITATPPPPPPDPTFWQRALATIRQEAIRPRADPRLPRLRELAALLDADWLAVVSRAEVEECEVALTRAAMEAVNSPGHRMFHFVCDRNWADLKATDEVKVRHCDACRHEVHYCDTIMEAREHAEEGHCVAVDLGIMRRENDLEGERLLMGMFDSDSYFRREEERLRPDPVSEARQRRKDAGAG